MKKLLFLLTLCGFPLATFAQKESMIIAGEFAKAYPEATVAANYIHIDYVFSLDKKSKELIVRERTEAEYLGLQKAAWAAFPKFYDTNSSIEEAKVLTKGEKYTFRIKDEYYNADGIFHADSRVRYISAYFDEYADFKKTLFIKRFNDPRYLTTSYFHSPFPAKHTRIIFSIPSWANIELKEMNFEGYEVQKEEKVDGDLTEITYRLKNIGPMDRKAGMPGISHIYPHILILVKDYTVAGKQKKFFKEVDDLYSWYASLVAKIENDNSAFTALVQEITKEAKTDEEKMKAVFYWVQKNIRYIAFEDGIAGFKPESCQNVFDKKYGDCKGMANLTKEMLKTLDIDARLTWLGTESLAYDYTIPSLAVDNHMICTVLDGDKTYFLDATEKYISFGEYAQRIQGKQVMIEDGNSYILKTIDEQPAENNTIELHQKLQLNEEQIQGKGDYTFLGESKSGILNSINYTKSKDQIASIKRFLSHNEKNFVIENLEHSDPKDLENAMTINYDFTLDNAVSSFGGELYVDLDFYKDFYHYEVETPRDYDFVFYNKKNILTTIDLEVPAGYSVKSVPENFLVKDDAFSFELGYTQKEGKVFYKKRIKVPGGKIPKGKIDAWNTAIEQLQEFYDSPVILVKD